MYEIESIFMNHAVYTTSLTFINFPFYQHRVFMCFVWISEQTATISLHNINWIL
jgi:hypothetical protein